MLVYGHASSGSISFWLERWIDVSKVQFSSDLFKGDNATGFFIGPMAEFTLPVVGLGIDAAALYSQSGLKIKEVKILKN